MFRSGPQLFREVVAIPIECQTRVLTHDRDIDLGIPGDGGVSPEDPGKLADLVDFLRDERLSLRTGFGLVSFGSLIDSRRSHASDDTPSTQTQVRV